MSLIADRLTAALADRYRIERELGAGGMATVYLAQDLKHDRKVAVKVLKPELAAVLGAERFLAEIKVTANLQHPNLLPLFDSGQADGFLYYVMPYVQGETLRARLERERQLPVDETVRLVTLLANALDYAHAQRRHPPGPQAGEHPAPVGPAGDRRLRHRAGGGPGRRPSGHRDRDLPRHPALHEPGAGRRRRGTSTPGPTSTPWPR